MRAMAFHRRLHCLLNSLFRRISKKISILRATGICKGNSPVTGEFPSQRARNAENVSTWWHHHGLLTSLSAAVLPKHLSYFRAIGLGEHTISGRRSLLVATIIRPWSITYGMMFYRKIENGKSTAKICMRFTGAALKLNRDIWQESHESSSIIYYKKWRISFESFGIELFL